MGEEEREEENQLPSSQIEPTETSESPKQHQYEWPKIRFDVPPYRTYHFHNQFRTGPNPNNFLKGVKWFHFPFFHLLLFSFSSPILFWVVWVWSFVGLLMAPVFSPVPRIILFAFSTCIFSSTSFSAFYNGLFLLDFY